MKKISILFIICYFIFLPKAFASTEYTFPWPGILPDNKLYKIKVLRNKIIEKMIVSPVKKVEFDLLMADKTIYASKLLVDKGEIDLAKDIALKGENYYSILAQDYNKSLQQKKKIPVQLDRKITLAAIKHQEVFKQLEDAVAGENKKTFQIASRFSKINYDFIVSLRNRK
ncbi:MAG: hypothetical protein HYV37_02295 [Candidatus Levyibacteriota bacterium]|nr:MAG: hypothetical protein HYV37_02295 [Candidatus Levybacteria bacterium]